MATLHLTLKKKFFDMIASVEKLEEYRELKEFWAMRLLIMEFDYIEGKRIIYNKKQHSNAFWYSIGLKKTRKGAIENLLKCCSVFKEFDKIIFRNGYASNAPEIIIECLGIEIGKAKPEWSDNWQGDVFIIKLGKIISQSPF